MIVFDDNEFEIIVVTYNRALFVEELLNRYYESCKERNIIITILDSSENDDTQAVVDRKKEYGWNVKYKRMPCETKIGYKSVAAILASQCRYVWVMGDSRFQRLEEMDEKVFPFVKDDITYITFYPDDRKDKCKIYSDMDEFLLENLDSTTCVGMSIYRAELFKKILLNPNHARIMHEKFAENYGFAWLGYTYYALAYLEGNVAYVNVGFSSINDKLKKQTWAKKFYGCWCDDLCNIVLDLPAVYKHNKDAVRLVWKRLSLDSLYYCFKGRAYGDVEKKIIKKMIKSGNLSICTDNIYRFYFASIVPKMLFRIALRMRCLVGGIYHMLKDEKN